MYQQNATQKVDSIIAENPDMSLDELLAAKKINQDQKAQAQKKPSLQASLSQLEEQVSQFKQFEEDFQKQLAAEKAALAASHKAELDEVRAAAVEETRAAEKELSREKLLVLSKFLRAAAAKRQNGEDTSPENRAFEGALLLVYGGEQQAVLAMEKLIEGSDEKVPTVDQVPSELTCKSGPTLLGILLPSRSADIGAVKQVKDLGYEYAPYAAEEAWAEDVAQADAIPPEADAASASAPTQTDPTIAHASLTEIEAEAQQPANGYGDHVETSQVPSASAIDLGAANDAAAYNADSPDLETKLEGSEEWVNIKERDPAETDTGLAATPGAMNSTQSWAEDVPTATPETTTTAPAPSGPTGDGFHEVQHRGGRGRGGGQGDNRGGFRGGRGSFQGDRRNDGEYRGGRGGGYRGNRGGEGGYRGRGRGGFRGGGRGRAEAA